MKYIKFIPNGTKEYYKDYILHRDDGPAIEYADGHKEWYQNDQLHREDGPAIECSNGNEKWYYQDKEIKCSSQEEFIRLLKLKSFWE